jgi:hypothetical protein
MIGNYLRKKREKHRLKAVTWKGNWKKNNNQSHYQKGDLERTNDAMHEEGGDGGRFDSRAKMAADEMKFFVAPRPSQTY